MRKWFRHLAVALVIVLLACGFAGCGDDASIPVSEDVVSEVIDLASSEIEEADTESEILSEEASSEEIVSETEAVSEAESAVVEADADLEVPDEDGSYDSKEDVAAYLHAYGCLPSNYITKKEAQNLGWSGGSVEKYAEGKCIGGQYYGNYEGILPDGSYHECDIDTLGASGRGAKRIVYSDDGNIYYTEDHYETFTLLYTADGPVTEEIIYK